MYTKLFHLGKKLPQCFDPLVELTMHAPYTVNSAISNKIIPSFDHSIYWWSLFCLNDLNYEVLIATEEYNIELVEVVVLVEAVVLVQAVVLAEECALVKLLVFVED